MEVPMLDVYSRIAKLQPGELITALNAYAESEYNLKLLEQRILDEIVDPGARGKVTVKALRCGWISKPPPERGRGAHTPHLGQLWVVYTQTGDAATALDSDFVWEKAKTAVLRGEVIRFLEHDTSVTRSQLAQTLRLRAELIEADAVNDPR